MIIARSLCLAFGKQIIFDNISFTIQKHERIGLYGLNGSGKSTLLKVIAGQHKLDSGTVSIAKDATLAYLPQDVVLQSNKSIIAEALSAFSDLAALEERYISLEAQLADNPNNTELIEEFAEICEQRSVHNPDQKRAEAERMLIGLGFTQANLNNSIQTLSVGWKMRVVLAKLLLQKADFYLFDEPTNHLDIVAKEWFLEFLKKAQFGFLLVCHEKRFLNQLCHSIMELDRGKETTYTGTYDDFVEQKEASQARIEQAYKEQQREIKRTQDLINKFRAKASKAGMAQSLIKKLDKIELIELPQTAKNITFSFPPLERTGKQVLEVRDVGYAFGEKKIFTHATFEVERGQRVAIVAANGVGKTTLLKVISGKLPLQTGSVQFGHNVHYAVFDQDQTASLDLHASVFQNACNAAPAHTSEQTIRSLLGAFLFTGARIEKKAGVLSGGERNRLGMVRVLLQNANLLLLDEPTNHLDIPSKDLLLKALQSYQGTIVFVSHDQDFVNNLATHIVELTPTHAAMYHGNYDEYMHQKSFAQSHNATTPQSSAHKTSPKALETKEPESFELRKKRNALESKIDKLEKTIMRIEQSFAGLDYGTPAFNAATQKLTEAQQKLDAAMTEWEQLSE